MQELRGQAAIITGASRGIGAATARLFGEAGVAVLLAARSTGEIEAIAAEIRGKGGKAEAVACDVADYTPVAGLVDRCRDTFGRLDILVNNAGVIEPIARLGASDPAEWDRVVDINYKGVYHGLRAAIPVMEAQGSGVIVNLSSGAATGALEGWSHYCSTKAAVLSLTRCADKEYREKGIRVCGLSPGTVATEMQVLIKASGINPVSQLDPSVHIPAEWVAKAIAWLCTKDASDIAGEDLVLREPESRRRIGLPV
ncbi:SDR family oxidoreductase [Oceanibacterium hippocampi]|uniref:3-oxoacyl-[acyl-carrier-protein] reductase FabG n=1 Tax=Oceanibacterium hippocampi TaxID=745714 RepID=A0A1Y5U066_9PROT|nr:SDR family oxidoreductase [Oceanibacterium hippocampi]SLN75771.1 3-oxoacyl-[acyl-carrier-protein] reductase FabG [Oceanibacterium hippocampi]